MLFKNAQNTNKFIRITRIWSMPNKWTFSIKPIKDLLNKYVGDGKDWIDPFAGTSNIAEITNDLNPDMNTKFHLDAVEFMEQFESNTKNGIILDPPYSLHQCVFTYKSYGKKMELTVVYDLASKVIVPGGYAISFGFNSNGLGKKRNFEIVEILMVAHGGHHNDTICLVERKLI